MNKIEFIPLVELPTQKDIDSEKHPGGTPLTNLPEWDLYQQKELKKNYRNIPDPISNGIYQYRLIDIDLEDLEAAIRLHISDTDINKSCSLFGGYAISVNGNIELYPQCCGLLEEIRQWENLLNENFEDFYLLTCHPSPFITKKESEIIIYCKDEFETFFPSTAKTCIRLNYQETKSAFLKMIEELKTFSIKLNTLSGKFGTDNISNILIWGQPGEK